MTASNRSTSGTVVVVGGGVAGLEALLALRALAGDRIDLTLISSNNYFVDRPMTVAEPFGLGSAARLLLPEVAAECGAEFVRGTVTAVDTATRRISWTDGPDLGFDTLILATGAQTRAPFSDAITWLMPWSGPTSWKRLMPNFLTKARPLAWASAAARSGGGTR